MCFTTNGNLLRSEHLDCLLASTASTVIFSVDAVSPGVYKRIRPAGDFQALIKSIDFLLENRKSARSPKVCVSFVRQTVNEHEEGAFVEAWRNRADEVCVTSEIYAGQPQYPPQWTPRGLLPCAPLEHSLHVLTNGDSASASEIVAAAMQQNDLATLVGTKTFGKGTFQEVIELEGGAALDLTVGEYLTADGSSILNEGVKPDVRAPDEDPADGDDTLDRGLEVVCDEIAAG